MKAKRDWGCLQWFLLGFAIFALLVFLIVLVSAPSGGGTNCQGAVKHMSNNLSSELSYTDRLAPLRGASGNSNNRTRLSVTGSENLSTGLVATYPHPVHLAVVDLHPVQSGVKPRPGSPPKGGSPAKPNLQKPKDAPRKATKGPSGPSGGIKVEVDVDDCD